MVLNIINNFFLLGFFLVACHKSKLPSEYKKSSFQNKSINYSANKAGIDDDKTKKHILEKIIPATISKENKDYKSCINKLDNLKEHINKYKSEDKNKVVLKNFPVIAHNMWYSKQTPGKENTNEEKIDDSFTKNVISGDQKDAGNGVEKDENIKKTLLGKRDFNEYLYALIQGNAQNQNSDLYWHRFIDEKPFWIGTLIINKERTVINDPTSLEKIFKGNKKLQQLMIESVEKQEDFFNSYIEMLKNNKQCTVDFLCDMTKIPNYQSSLDSDKHTLYFKALVYNCLYVINDIVKKITKGENGNVNKALKNLNNVTEEYLKIDPTGEALAEFTKLLYKDSGPMKIASKFFKKKRKQAANSAKIGKSSFEVAEKIVSGMKITRQALKLSFFIKISQFSDIQRSKEANKLLNARFQTFIKLLKTYLTFGIEFSNYLKTCSKVEITQRISTEF